MKRWLAIVLVPLVLFAAGTRPASSARPNLVLAFYYDWYDENIWKPDQVADLPTVRYASRDPQTVARQIQQARDAGIDAFVVSWWGAGNPTDDNFKMMLDRAAAANFKVAIDFEVTSPFYHSQDQVVASLRSLLATHARRPSYLSVDGKPVVFFWREQVYSVATWKAIRDAVDPNRQSLWIAEGVDPTYLDVFDGHHLYSIGWSQNPASDLQHWGARVRAFGPNKIWVATVMPGYDDTRTLRPGAYVRDRRGGEFYRETWRGALSSYPDWVIITSWNEWVEGTMIEPSVTYGDLYLDITREFAGSFKAGLPSPTPVQVRRVAKASATATLTPVSEGVRVTVTDTLRVRAAPSTDASILGRLRPGTAVTALARSEDGDWLQIAYPDGLRRAWIASAFTTTAQDIGDLPALPEALPTAAPSATATPTEAFDWSDADFPPWY